MFAMTCWLFLAALGLSALTSANKMPEPVGSVSSSLIQSQSTVAESKQPEKLALPDSTAKPHDDKAAEKKPNLSVHHTSSHHEAGHKTNQSDDHAPIGDSADEGKKVSPAQHTPSKDRKVGGNSKLADTNGSSASHEGAKDSDRIRKEALHHVEKAMKEVTSKETQSAKAIEDAHGKEEAAQKAATKVFQAKKQATKAEAKLHNAEKKLHDQVEAGQKSQAASQCSLWLGTVACGLGAVMLVQ